MRAVSVSMGLALALVLVVSLIASPSQAAIVVGDKAPDFRLDNVAGGDAVRLSNFTNKPALLVFWVSWCSHCQDEAPVIEKVYKDLGSRGISVLGVTADDNVGDARNFVNSHHVSFANAFGGSDEGQAVISMYGVRAVPTIFVLDKGGVVKARFVGETDEATIRNEFSKLGVK